MNDHLHAFFDDVDDYDFRRQLKLHIIYYACNCIGQDEGSSESENIEHIRQILNDAHLTEAFRNFKMPHVPVKLKIQLMLMKQKSAGILYYLKKH